MMCNIRHVCFETHVISALVYGLYNCRVCLHSDILDILMIDIRKEFHLALLMAVTANELNVHLLQQTSSLSSENESTVIVQLKQLESLRQRMQLLLQQLRDVIFSLQTRSQ